MINTPYLFESDFDIQDILEPVKQDIIDKFVYDKLEKKTGEGYNTSFDNPEFNREISKRFVHAVNEHFIIDQSKVVYNNDEIHTVVNGELYPIRPWIYCQNNKHQSSVWHSHISTSTINAVMYYDVPKSGGALELDILNNPFVLTPEAGKIYFFPYWAAHRPLPQKDKRWRICINLEFFDGSRAIRKNGVLW